MLEGKLPWQVRDILDLVNKQKNGKIQFSKLFSKINLNNQARKYQNFPNSLFKDVYNMKNKIG